MSTEREGDTDGIAGEPASDTAQYEPASIDDYERVFGRDFVSPGGAATARELVERLDLPPGARVLDAGAGLGGAAFLMARERGFLVDGIDLSSEMVRRARARAVELGLVERVAFERGDCLELERPGRYDAVHSRDVFLHIADKGRLFGVLRDALVPGGTLLLTDYCSGERPWSAGFVDYVARRGYHLMTPEALGAAIAGAGFESVRVEDLGERFAALLERDLATIAALDVGAATRERLAASWRGKLERARSGEHRWALVEARAPG